MKRNTQYNSQIFALAMPQSNALSDIGRGLTDVGNVLENQEKTKSEKEAFKIKNDTLNMQSQMLKEDRADNALFSNMVDYDDYEKFAKENTFHNGRNVALAKDYFDKNKKVFESKEIDDAWGQIIKENNGEINEGAFKSTMKKVFEDDTLPNFVAVGLMDRYNKHNLTRSQVHKNKESKTPSVSDTIKVNTYTARQKNIGNENENYLEAFGREMNEAETAEYLANGKKTYTDYKAMTPKQKEQIGAQVELDRVIKELKSYSKEELDSISGHIVGNSLVEGARSLFHGYTERQNNLIQLLGKLDSEEMHKLYGAALTGTEAGRAAKWNFEKSQNTSKLMASVNALAEANSLAIKNTKQGIVNFPIKDYEYGQIFADTKAKKPVKAKKKKIIYDTNSTKENIVTVNGKEKKLIF